MFRAARGNPRARHPPDRWREEGTNGRRGLGLTAPHQPEPHCVEKGSALERHGLGGQGVGLRSTPGPGARQSPPASGGPREGGERGSPPFAGGSTGGSSPWEGGERGSPPFAGGST